MDRANNLPHNMFQSTFKKIGLLGPGIMMATLSVGGSHLVASTKAGAIYGWQLVALILLVNLFKYPFFRASVHYTLGTGRSLIEGYAHLGKPYLVLFSVLSVISSIVNTAALLFFSASLLAYFIPIEISTILSCIIVLSICFLVLFIGNYKALDSLSKVLMLVLTVATLTAVSIAADNYVAIPETFEPPSPWTLAALGFIIITMGWMPAPIEVSSVNSMWLKTQKEQQNITPRSALFDFNVGYIVTAILAVAFLSLGALVLYGKGVELSQSGVGFSHQLVGLYASTIGEWSRYLIAIIAFFCIFGSTITLLDGYARVVTEAQQLLTKNKTPSNKTTVVWTIIIALLALAIIYFSVSSLIPMLNFAMTMAFVTTPFFALLNYLLLIKTPLPEELKIGRGFKCLAVAGLIYLFTFLALFIWWKWLM